MGLGKAAFGVWHSCRRFYNLHRWFDLNDDGMME